MLQYKEPLLTVVIHDQIMKIKCVEGAYRQSSDTSVQHSAAILDVVNELVANTKIMILLQLVVEIPPPTDVKYRLIYDSC